MRQIGLQQEALKAAPPVSVIGAQKIFGFGIDDWILVLVAIYTICQIIVILPKVYRTIMNRRDKRS